jgi:tripartite-type tricarboxylate transporter receptor subunit TctC
MPDFENSIVTSIDTLRALYAQPIERSAKKQLDHVNEACVADPKFSARTIELGYIPFVSTRAEFSAFVAESTEKWAKVIQAVGIKVE